MGNTIIGCFYAFSIVSVLFMASNIVLSSIETYKIAKKEGKEKGSISCVQILAIPFQSSGMDFGQINYQKIRKLVKKKNIKIGIMP